MDPLAELQSVATIPDPDKPCEFDQVTKKRIIKSFEKDNDLNEEKNDSSAKNNLNVNNTRKPEINKSVNSIESKNEESKKVLNDSFKNVESIKNEKSTLELEDIKSPIPPWIK